jgi:16S rRNA (guanine527-N7)-methyltransferase
LKKGALGLFPKGQDVASELTEAAKYWKIEHSLIRSRTAEKAQILVVRHLEPVRAVRPRNPQSKGRRRP